MRELISIFDCADGEVIGYWVEIEEVDTKASISADERRKIERLCYRETKLCERVSR